MPTAPHEGSHKVSQRPSALASPAPTTIAVPCIPALPTQSRRRKRFKTKAVSPEPANTTSVPKVPKPTTAEASLQTDSLPPPPLPPLKEDVCVQAALTTYTAACQTPSTAPPLTPGGHRCSLLDIRKGAPACTAVACLTVCTAS